MRMIDGDKLLEIYKKWIPQLVSKEDEGDRRGVETCIMVLEDMQTVDAVPVVRCKDCRHMERSLYGRYCHIWGMYNGYGDDGFCCYGERKDGGENG